MHLATVEPPEDLHGWQRSSAEENLMTVSMFRDRYHLKGDLGDPTFPSFDFTGVLSWLASFSASFSAFFL